MSIKDISVNLGISLMTVQEYVEGSFLSFTYNLIDKKIKQTNKQARIIFADRSSDSETHILISRLDLQLLLWDDKTFLVDVPLFRSCVGDCLLERRRELSENRNH